MQLVQENVRRYRRIRGDHGVRLVIVLRFENHGAPAIIRERTGELQYTPPVETHPVSAVFEKRLLLHGFPGQPGGPWPIDDQISRRLGGYGRFGNGLSRNVTSNTDRQRASNRFGERDEQATTETLFWPIHFSIPSASARGGGPPATMRSNGRSMKRHNCPCYGENGHSRPRLPDCSLRLRWVLSVGSSRHSRDICRCQSRANHGVGTAKRHCIIRYCRDRIW